MQDVKPRRGRPPQTTHAQVSQLALELFARDGFEETTVEQIAAAAGINRRTLFRYFPSKNDIVWGDFEHVLDRLRTELDRAGPDTPLTQALAAAAVASNRYPAEQLPELRIRMTLITTVPSLQAHSMLRYAAWRAVVAEFAGRRLGEPPDSLAPVALGYAALAASMAAFSHWVQHEDADLEALLAQTYTLLRDGFAVGVPT
jgi:mycofactocin system transcriptional regulator